MNARTASALAIVLLGFAASVAGAVVIETVPVGDAGNAGELSGAGAGGDGTDRICGAVSYAYNIGKYEVTAGQYCEFLNAVAKTDTHELYSWYMGEPRYCSCNIKRSGSQGSYTYSVASDWANRPVNYIAWKRAARFANWLTNGQPTGQQDASTTEDGSYFFDGTSLPPARKAHAKWVIPSEDEWYKAAYYDPNKAGGAGYWSYPMRSDAAPNNVLSATDLNSANFFNGTYTIGSPYYRTDVGAFAGSPSAYGTFDQGGNVSEWNEALFYEGAGRGLRGGGFGYDGDSMRASHRGYYFPSGESTNLGFRVVQVPDPATLSLLALAGIGLLARRSADRFKTGIREIGPSLQRLLPESRPDSL